ncbi:hypothetical protein ScPMuIL_000670 [Solemya velum]
MSRYSIITTPQSNALTLNMWTYLLVVCGVLFLTDARECDDAIVFYTERRACVRTVFTIHSQLINQVAALVNDGFISQSDLRIATSAMCMLAVPLRSCMSAGLKDCSNYVTEIEPLLSAENLMCNSDESLSEELQTMVNGFSSFDINRDCVLAASNLSRCEKSPTPLSHTPSPVVLTKNIPKFLVKTVHEGISCLVRAIQDADVSACGRESDVLVVGILRMYVFTGGVLSLPFDYSDLVGAVDVEREKKDILGTFFGF